MKINQRPRKLYRRGGFTFVELMLSLAITSLVAITAVAMLGAMSSATQVEHDTRRATIKRQVAITRLGATVRRCAMVLSAGVDHVVLWVGDIDGSRNPNLSELVRIEWQSDDQWIMVYEADPNLLPASDTPYVLGDDFSAITNALAGGSTFPGSTILHDVSVFDLTLDAVAVQDTRVVQIGVTMDHDSGEDIAVMVSGLRSMVP